MSANDVVLVSQALRRDRTRLAPNLSEDQFANFYCASLQLRADNLSDEEVLEGIVDGGLDCGIDAMYTLVNNLHLRDDTPLTNFGRNPRIELRILQVKNSPGFKEDAVDKILVALPRLLDFGRDEVALSKVANPRLLESTRRFLAAYEQLDMPQLSVIISFISTKAERGPHENVVRRAELLRAKMGEIFGAAATSVEFVDAEDVLKLALALPTVVKKLPLAENPISTNRAGGYVALVALREYAEFITLETGELNTALFEANVRDYEGETSVNQSIQETVSKETDDVDFWWLNNGITIVADKVQLAHKVLELETPQIVNGLQTSTEIYKALSVRSADRGVLVKVIQVSEPQTRDRIIRATNAQTSFGPSALKATDHTQRRIEEYLAHHGLYYERRRRQYQNLSSRSIVLSRLTTWVRP